MANFEDIGKPGHCEKCGAKLAQAFQEVRSSLGHSIYEYWACPLHGREWKHADNRN